MTDRPLSRSPLLILGAMAGALGGSTPVPSQRLFSPLNHPQSEQSLAAIERANSKRARKNARRRASLRHQHDREAANV